MTKLAAEPSNADAIVAESVARLKARHAAASTAFDPALGATFVEAQAKKILLQNDLGAYATWITGHVPAAHHQYWLDIMMALEGGRLPQRRVLIISPPNTAKSVYTSTALPPWYLGRHPDHSMLFLTSSAPMANAFGNTVKAILERNPSHEAAFPDPSCRPNVDRGWSSDGLYLRGAPVGAKDPSYRSVGMGASVVGARANVIIVDDPIDQSDAESEAEVNRAKRYIDLTVVPRLQPDGWLLVITTRWNDMDVASHLLAQALEDDGWLIVQTPMHARADDVLGRAEGELLWPERYSEAYLEKERRRLGTASYNAIFELDPAGLGGDVFKDASWFRPLPSDFWETRDDGRSLRDRLTVVQAWDTAFSEHETAAYSACVTVGVDSQMNRYLLHVWRGKLNTMALEDKMVEQIMSWRPNVIGVEEAAFRMKVTQAMVHGVRTRIPANIHILKPTRDKVARARLPAAAAEAGKYFVDRGAPWFPHFEAEALAFPHTPYKDQVDALSLGEEIIVAATMARPRPTMSRMSPHSR